MTIRQSPLRPSTSLAILFFDWLVFALTVAHVHNWAKASVVGTLGAALVVAVLENLQGATLNQLLLRALIAGAIVAVPFPILGTAVAVTFLIWSAVASAQRAA